MDILSVTSRTITLEVKNDSPYYAAREFDVYLDAVWVCKETRNVFTIMI